jgi:hypothetical protein
MTEETLGFDTSQWQDAPETVAFIDPSKAVAQGAKFAIPRFSYGLIPDRIGPRAYDAYKSVGLITGAYDFADYRTYAKYNVAAFIKHLDGRVPAFVAPDLENNETYWPGMWPSDGSRLTYWIWDWISEFKLTGLPSKILLYTNLDTIRQMRAAPTLLAKIASEVGLWVAAYNPWEPTLASIAPWPKWTVWQPQKRAVGKLWGMESGDLDIDWWNGSLAQLEADISSPQTGTSTPIDGSWMDAIDIWARTMGYTGIAPK